VLSSDQDAATWAERGSTFEHGTSTPGVQAAAAAYLDGSRALLAALLARYLPGVGYQPPEGTYLAWLDCRALAADLRTDVSPAEFFLAQGRVMLTEGALCGDAGRGHVRLNFATPRPILAEIVRRMAGAANGGR